MNKEPLITIGTIGSLIGAAIVMLQAFGVPITDAQSDAINQFVIIAAPILVALVGRQFVFSPNTVAEIEEEAAASGVSQMDREIDAALRKPRSTWAAGRENAPTA